MEDFEKIKSISLEEVKKVLPKNIAYLTMKNGEVLIVNGLDHKKFNQRKKEYEDWMEEQSKIRTISQNFNSPLIKMQEDVTETKGNNNHINIEENLGNEYNIPENLNKSDYTLNRNNPYFKSYNNKKPQYRIIQNENNNIYSLNNNQINKRKKINFPIKENYRNVQLFSNYRDIYYFNRNQISQNKPNYYFIEKDRNFIPIQRDGHFNIRDDMNRRTSKYDFYN